MSLRLFQRSVLRPRLRSHSLPVARTSATRRITTDNWPSSPDPPSSSSPNAKTASPSPAQPQNSNNTRPSKADLCLVVALCTGTSVLCAFGATLFCTETNVKFGMGMLKLGMDMEVLSNKLQAYEKRVERLEDKLYGKGAENVRDENADEKMAGAE